MEYYQLLTSYLHNLETGAYTYFDIYYHSHARTPPSYFPFFFSVTDISP